jgi:mannose-6-phosphate isomerase-like protein (cupin superfamily)
MSQEWERGWQRYSFDTVGFADAYVHGGDVEIPIGMPFNRGAGQPQTFLGVVPPGAGTQPIGMHVHRDLPANTDLEEWWVIIEGEGEMTFSNGDVVALGPGDVVATFPGTGHSFRVTGETPVRLVAFLPKMFTTRTEADRAPAAAFAPTIVVEEVDESTLNPTVARCARCDERWNRLDDGLPTSNLPKWAREHASHAATPATAQVS